MARTSGSSFETTASKVWAEAARLFAQKGYAAVSMREIAQAVGVQAGALYTYTPDKQSLLFALLERHMSELLAQCPEFEVQGDATDQLCDFVGFHIDFHLARRHLVFLSYMELRNLDEDNFAKIEALRHRYEAQLRGILDRGKSGGQFDIQNAKVTSFAIIGMMKELSTWYRTSGELSATEIKEMYLGLVAKMVGI